MPVAAMICCRYFLKTTVMKKNVFIALFALLSTAAQAQTKNFIDQPYIEVSGSADTLVTPNQIFIRILISEKDTKDKITVEELETKMADALKAIGIDIEKDLTTRDMVSNFRTYLLKNRDIIKSKQYILKVTNAEMAGKVFAELEKLDISNAYVERIDHSDMEKIKNSMRTKAVENARDRGAALTKPLGQTLGNAIHIADNETYNINYRPGSNLDEVLVRGLSTKNRSDTTPRIDFEQLKITTNINVKFILK